MLTGPHHLHKGFLMQSEIKDKKIRLIDLLKCFLPGRISKEKSLLREIDLIQEKYTNELDKLEASLNHEDTWGKKTDDEIF